jgi:hypothetical protein
MILFSAFEVKAVAPQNKLFLDFFGGSRNFLP